MMHATMFSRILHKTKREYTKHPLTRLVFIDTMSNVEIPCRLFS